MTVRWCAASTWSSAIRGKPRSRKAASSPRRQRCTCRMLLSWTQRTASRRASGSSLSVKVTSAEKCGLPSARESRSMADNESKPKSKPGKKLEAAANDLGLIAGQRAVITKARKSIATYKVREGQPIGCKVTLRKSRMYEFMDRLVNIALPRVRDFRGLSPKSFDGRGNYSLGIREHIVFP